jgi:hypothetical protein
MEAKDHLTGVGNIVTNLQALGSVLRGFLVERYGQCAGSRKKKSMPVTQDTRRLRGPTMLPLRGK